MSAIQPVTPAVQWFEGMLLSPQHFQQNNLYVEQLLFHQLQRVSPFYYGFLDLSFDLPALADKLVRVRQLHGVMPDGTIVNYQKSDTQIAASRQAELTLDLNDIAEMPAMQPFHIYLAIATQRDSSNYGGHEEFRRYDSVNSGKVKDIHDENNQVDVPRLELKLQLITEAQLSPNYACLPLLLLQRKHDGSYQRLDYTPPCLRINPLVSETPAQSEIWQKVEQKLGRLRTKANERRDYFSGGGSRKTPLSNMQKLELLTITRHLPKLQIMINSQSCHPFDFYLALVDMCAAMAAVQGDGIASDYRNYSHEKLDDVFAGPLNDLDDVIYQMELDFEISTFIREQQNAFSCKLVEHDFAQPLYLSFRMATGVTREQASSWIENAYISGSEQQENLLLNRITGLSRTKVSEFEELGVKENDDEVLFLVELNERYCPPQADQQLLISSSDGDLDKFAPAAISWYRPRL